MNPDRRQGPTHFWKSFWKDIYGERRKDTAMNKKIFVFGSNLRGAHGAGAALFAHQNRGAVIGHGVGLMGDSYGIPTKDMQIRTLPLQSIRVYVDQFIAFAKDHPDLTFEVTAIGCGLAGYTPADIAPMFRGAPSNCEFDPRFLPFLEPVKEG